ncbi:unnamed protein product, partial [Prorocentrum cordatum]
PYGPVEAIQLPPAPMQRLLANRTLASIVTESFDTSGPRDLRQLGRLALTCSQSLTVLLSTRAQFQAWLRQVQIRAAESGVSESLVEEFWRGSLGDVLCVVGTLRFPGEQFGNCRLFSDLVESLERAGEDTTTLHAVVASPASSSRVWAPLHSRSDPTSTESLVHEVIFPRLMLSIRDALYCHVFVRRLIETRSIGLHFLDFQNCWTQYVKDRLKKFSSSEAVAVGVYTREMMKYVVKLRENSDAWLWEENPCFERHYHLPELEEPRRYVTAEDLRRAHGKWECRLAAGIIECVRMSPPRRRNALVFMTECIDAFPATQSYADQLRKELASIRDRVSERLAVKLLFKLRGRDAYLFSNAPKTETSFFFSDCPLSPLQGFGSSVSLPLRTAWGGGGREEAGCDRRRRTATRLL